MMGKLIKNISIFLFASLLLTGCWVIDQDEPEIKLASGTVSFIGVEGGFIGILGDKGQNYDPINLPVEYCIHGLRISFLYRDAEERTSIHMWGIIIEILAVTVIE